MKKTDLEYADILFKKSPDISNSRGYSGFHPETKILPRGHVRYEGKKPLPCDIILERDAAITLRDGTVIYADIFRPVTEEKIPAILSISPFGKELAEGASADEGPTSERFHIPGGTLSGYQKFEAVDPAYWCRYGYAVLNVDSRGINSSEGNACYFGPQDAADGYDIVEWCAGRDWCSGKVTMAGNSWLGINQWYVASAKPPHLTCIAPWEGHGDMYNDEYMRGGIPHPHLTRIDLSPGGLGKEEDLYRMVQEYPFWNSYWEDKRAKFEDVEVPAYVSASYTNGCHTHGTFEGFRNISSKEKWLRIHNTQEWPDLYNEKNCDDLRKFYDHYMKGADNGWEKTPRVRMSVLDPGGQDIVGRPEEDFPPVRTVRKTVYLDAANGSISETLPEKEAKIEYDARNEGEFMAKVKESMRFQGPFAPLDKSEAPTFELDSRRAQFFLKFNEDTEISGYIRLKLWMEVRGDDDMDLYIRAMNVDGEGNPLFHNALSQMYSGPSNKLRVSHRELDLQRTKGDDLAYTHTHEDKLSPGEIVPVEISLWPTALQFHRGEQLMIQIAGYDDMGPEGYNNPMPSGRNNGIHIIHTGGKYDSQVILPVVPARSPQI